MQVPGHVMILMTHEQQKSESFFL
uniref:Uncharacterized protein n=1 Tax=Arundo donax TaxID=35708 RepID=A0A0A8XXX0_ARUDO